MRCAFLSGLPGLALPVSAVSAWHGRRRRPPPFPRSSARPGDPAVIARGSALYAIQCRAATAWTCAAATWADPTCCARNWCSTTRPAKPSGRWCCNGRNPPGGKPMPRAAAAASRTSTRVAEYIHSVVATCAAAGRAAAGREGRAEPAGGQCARGRALFQGAVRQLPFRHRRPGRHRHARAEHRAAAEQLGIRPARRRRPADGAPRARRR